MPVNSLLLIEPDSQEAAEVGDEVHAVTAEVRCYTWCQDNIHIKIWDMPDLGNRHQMRFLKQLVG